jgi:exosome complex exonuclease DIS3/RRP44
VHPVAAALKNDDADDSEAEHQTGETAARLEERKLLQREARERALAEKVKEKQPTGKVVGVIKRNWRTYVALSFRSSRSLLFFVDSKIRVPH